MLLCQIQTSLILKKLSLSAPMSNTDIFSSQKGEYVLLCQIQTALILIKVSLSASMSNADIFSSQKGESECSYVKYRHL